MRIRRSLLLIALVGVVTAATAGPAAAGGARTRLVSASSTGVQGNAESTAAAISGHGRYVTFESAASNLVPGDTNGFGDVFVRDVNTGTTSRVSVSSTGAQANYLSTIGSISGNGRYVTFISHATNLVPGDTNDVPDVFVRDLRAGTTRRVNVSSTGAQANDRSIGTAISADGRYVTFGSEASNLVPGDTNGAFDVFVRDLRAGATGLVSVSSTGAQGNDFSVGSEISADGRYVAFTSVASNLVPGDTNNSNDVFVRDRRTGTTSRVSVTSTGAQASTDSYFSKISADGRYVAFSSPATNLVPDDTNQAWDVFVRDRRAGTTTRVSVTSTGAQANGVSSTPSISADGRYVAFTSDATNLVPGDTNRLDDAFVRDLRAGTTTRVSVTSTGAQASGGLYPSISANGRRIAFISDAPDLVPGDTNGVQDVFLRDRHGSD